MGVLGLGGAGRVVRRFRGGGGGLQVEVVHPNYLRPSARIYQSLVGSDSSNSINRFRFFARKQSGQSNLQAGGGALAGLGGFAGGANLEQY